MNGSPPGRVLISYAQESAAHVDLVTRFCGFLRDQGIDAHHDQLAAPERINWVDWTQDQVMAADRVLVVASAEYRRRFEGTAPAGIGGGVRLEAQLIREEMARDLDAAFRKFVPVLLGRARVVDIPTLLFPYSGRHFRVDSLTPHGAGGLLAMLRHGPAAGRTADPGSLPAGPSAALHLIVSGGDPVAADEVSRHLLDTGLRDVQECIGADTRTSGARVLDAPDRVLGALGSVVLAIYERLSATRTSSGSATPSPVDALTVRIGAHVATDVAEAAAGALRIADSPAARRMHGARGADLVIAMSPEIHGLLDEDAHPEPGAYREWPLDGTSGPRGWIAVAGHTRSPDLPPAAPSAGLPVDGSGPFRIGILNVHGPLQQNARDGHQTFHYMVAPGEEPR